MPTNRRGRLSKSRQPRIDPPRERVERNRMQAFVQLRAELDTLRQHIAEAEARLAALEDECRRREKRIRACSMCGRLSTRPGPDAECPYCKNGRLKPV
ncbi:hypothetical protein [Haladaptatus sp. NG-WS-4]